MDVDPMGDENETETGEVFVDKALESTAPQDGLDPVQGKQRLLKLIDDELDDTPKGLTAKEIVNDLPLGE